MTILDYLDHEVDDKHTDKGQAMRLAEHEFMLSFNNDVGAYAFEDFWHDEGKARFAIWIKENYADLKDQV